jgi:hypothetical protein
LGEAHAVLLETHCVNSLIEVELPLIAGVRGPASEVER